MKILNWSIILIYMYLSIYHNCIFSHIYPLFNGNRLIGENSEFITPKNNIHSLIYFAEKFQIGIRNMLAANPEVDLYLPDPEKKLIIPKKLILPDTLHTGIIINSAEMRLFCYLPHKKNKTVIILPISIGTYNHETPSNWITSIKYKKKILLGYLPPICVLSI